MDMFAGMAVCLGVDLVSFAAVALLAAWHFARRFGLTLAQRRELVTVLTLAGTLVHLIIVALLGLLVALLTGD